MGSSLEHGRNCTGTGAMVVSLEQLCVRADRTSSLWVNVGWLWLNVEVGCLWRSDVQSNPPFREEAVRYLG